MIYIYFGSDYGYTQHCFSKDLKKNDTVLDIIKYDAYKDSLVAIIEDCNSVSLFDDKKTVVVYNAFYFSNQAKKGLLKLTEDDIKSLTSYFLSSPDESDLYLLCNDKLDSTNDLVKQAKDGKNVRLVSCELPTEEELTMLAYKIAKEEKKEIDKSAVQTLIERNKGDYLSFINNLTKLFLYTDHVDLDSVDLLVYKPLEDNIFDVVSRLMNNNIRGALHLYKDLRLNGNEPLLIIPVFISQFRFFACVKYLIDKRMSNDDIASELSTKGSKVSTGRIYYAKKDLQHITFKKLITILTDLGDIEFNIKMNGDDADTDLELFISTFKEKYYSY